MKLPETVKKKMYVSVGLGKFNYGDISIRDFSTEEHMNGFESKTVSIFEIEVDLPSDFDGRSAMIEILTVQKSKLEADHYVAVKRINDQIAELLAITNNG